MLYTCAPHTAAAANPKSRKTIKVKNKRKAISVDLHCHIHTPPADDIAKQTAGAGASPTARYGNPRTEAQQKKLHDELLQKLTSVEQRIKDMDRMDIDVQAISTSPLQYYYGVETDLARKIARTINERLTEITETHPDRFAPLGTLPMQEPELAVQELEYCMKKLNFKGIEIGTNVGGVEIADARYEKMWARCQELGAVVFLHPIGFTSPQRLTQHHSSAGAHRVRRRTGALPQTQNRHRPRWRLFEPLPGAHGSRLPRAPRMPRPHHTSAVVLHEENLLRHRGVRRTATGSPGEYVRRGSCGDRHRLPVRYGLLQAGGFCGKSEKTHAHAEGSDYWRNCG
jgi:predicted TIM-barrel fold metal-dependent hydrolase